MTLLNFVHQHIDEHLETIQLVRGSLSEKIQEVGQVLARSFVDGGTIFWCGNGGSAADSQHLAAELIGRFKKSRAPLRSIALTTDTSVLTCVANDFGYDDIFSRQIEALGRLRDVLVIISTSGNSENVVRAIDVAKKMGIVCVALLGKGGGRAESLAEYTIIVPSDSTARIQEAHILMGHIFCEIIERELGFA